MKKEEKKEVKKEEPREEKKEEKKEGKKRRREKNVLGFVVMASGHSRRFGRNKLMEPISGRPMIAYCFQNLSALLYEMNAVGSLSETVQESEKKEKLPISLDAPIVVTRFPEVQELSKRYHFPVIMHNEENQSDTIRIALSSQEAKNWTGCMFLTGDQPLLYKESLRRMVLEFSKNKDQVVRLSYQGEGGNPVIFPKKYFEVLKNLTGDHGGGFLLKNGVIPLEEIMKVSVEREYELFDVDSEDSLERIEQLIHLS